MEKTIQEKINKFFKSGEKGIVLFNRWSSIYGCNFSSANFRYADFRSADFRSADFRYADFRSANFSSADFRSADFSSANFRSTDFRYADFSSADFSSADFRSANFSSADFSYADFSYANFRSTDFRYADFSSADFSSADLDIKINESTIGLTIECPEIGSFIAYKKASGYIIELFISEDAKRNSATTKKCRASKVKCLSITKIDGDDSGLTEIASDYDKKFIYKIGEYIEVTDFDTNRWNECSTGIHFFMNRKLAECWNS